MKVGGRELNPSTISSSSSPFMDIFYSSHSLSMISYCWKPHLEYQEPAGTSQQGIDGVTKLPLQGVNLNEGLACLLPTTQWEIIKGEFFFHNSSQCVILLYLLSLHFRGCQIENYERIENLLYCESCKRRLKKNARLK